MRALSRSIPLLRWSLLLLILFVAPPMCAAQITNAESAVLGSWKYNPYPGDAYTSGDLVFTLSEHTLKYTMTLLTGKKPTRINTDKYEIESTTSNGSVLTLTSTREYESATHKIIIEVEMDKITITSNSFKKPSGEFLGREVDTFSLSPDHKTLTHKFYRSAPTLPKLPPVEYVFSR